MNPLPKEGITDNANATKSPYEIVVMGEAAKRFKTNMWTNLAKTAEHERLAYPNSPTEWRGYFESNMLRGEDMYMDKYHGSNPEAKDKKGQWKYRAFLPSSYRTAKSVAANALEHNVPLYDDLGQTLGKTAVEGSIKAKTAAEPVSSKTPYQKCQIVIGTLEKLIPQLEYSPDRLVINEELQKLRTL